MRKRLVLGAIVAVVTGIAAYMLSLPKRGSIEWHKRGYLESYERVTQNTLKQKLQRLYRRVAGHPRDPGDSSAVENFKAFDCHVTSLIRLGYLQKARVSLTNAPATTAMNAGYRGRHPHHEIRRFINISLEGDQIVSIIAPRSELPMIEAAIRKADVPETNAFTTVPHAFLPDFLINQPPLLQPCQKIF